jgi:hypothetical protein
MSTSNSGPTTTNMDKAIMEFNPKSSTLLESTSTILMVKVSMVRVLFRIDRKNHSIVYYLSTFQIHNIIHLQDKIARGKMQERNPIKFDHGR